MNATAERICALGRRFYERGLIASAEGNLSARTSENTIICTPAGVCKGELTAASLCHVDLNGGPRGAGSPSSEIYMHLALYEADSRIGAVVHTHSPFATTFAALGEALPAGILAESEIYLGHVPMIPYREPGTRSVGAALAPFARDCVAAILQNHGAVAWGPTLDLAANYAESLEAICRVVYQARLIGTPRPIPLSELDALRHRRERHRAI